MSHSHKPRQELYAIVRVDSDLTDPELAVTVKKVVRSKARTDDEVRRLNQLNSSKGARYFSQMTRLFADDEIEG